MFTNPKELEKYWRTAWYLEYFPYSEEKEIQDDGQGGQDITITKIQPSFSDNPIMFRYKFKNQEGNTSEETTVISGRISLDVGAILETRSKLPFKKEDLILDNLEKLPYNQTNRLGIPYKNFSRIGNTKERIDEEIDISNLMFKTQNEIIKEIVIG